MFKPDHIVIHHSASEDGEYLDADNLRRIHKAKGWSDIGYHAVVDKVGSDYEVILGRPMTIQGAHCLGLNHRSFGICFVGNFSKSKPSGHQLATGIDLWVVPTMLAYNISPDRVLPHRKAGKTATECPGNFFPWTDFIEEVEKAWKHHI